MASIADPRAEQHKQVLSTLRRKRSHFEQHWEDIAWRLLPAHKDSFRSRGYTNAWTPGRLNQEKSFDSTAALALQKFASVYDSLNTPQGQRWHRLVPIDQDLRDHRPTREYLDQVTEVLFKERYRFEAGFVGQQQKVYLGLGAYGNGLMFIDALRDKTGLRYKNLHLGESFVMENHQGVVDSLYRSFFINIRQAFQEYGEGIPDSWKRQMRDPKQMEDEKEILHVIRPRTDFDPLRLDNLAMPFESLHFAVEENKLLRESGYRTFPVAMSRYVQFANETYGRGPAQTVNPAIKILNEEKKVLIKQGHRIVDPVLLVHDDGQIGTFSLRPGAINPGGVDAQGRSLVQTLPTGNVLIGKDMMDDERAVINDAFLITLFQILVETPQMTATEVLERAREKGVLLAPNAGRFQQEFLGPMITREIDVLSNLGKLPPPPQRLMAAGAGFEVEYENPMARMVRSENAAGFMRALDGALNIVQITQDPSVLDWFDFDEAMPEIQDISGAPTAWTRTEDEVAAIRARREQERQQDKAIAAGPSIAAMAKVQQDNRNQ